MLVNEKNINHIFVSGQSWTGSIYVMALHKSTDGGQTWTTYKITTAAGSGYAVAIDPNNDDIIYVGGYYETSQGTKGGLFKTSDGGNTWTEIGGGVFNIQWNYIYAIAVDPNLPSTIYVGAAYRGVYKSEDSGSSWIQPSSYFDVDDININPAATNEIFAGGWNGVYFSNDRGRTWREFNLGLTCKDVLCLDMNRQGNSLYAGTYSGSAYKNNLLNLYTLTINAGTGGTTDPSPGTYYYDFGAQVTVTAIPNTGYRFSGWSGDASGTTNPITITMDKDKSVTANFIRQYTLTIASGTGGTTNPTPGSYTHDFGAQVTVTAVPNTGYRFSGWSGDASGTTNPITITMDKDKSITANFIRQYTLTIAAGTGGTTNPVPGSYTHDSGAQISITAVPNTGYRFGGWTGDASGTTNPITITMDKDKSITANFIRQYTLTIAAGAGGTTNPSPGTYTHDSGAQVSITATANSGYQFSGWSGSASGTTNPITITMDSDKSVTASFTSTAKPPEEGKKGGCFIATAAYGSPLHPHVNILRDFRDKYLISSKLGRAFVRLYYKYSPAAADFIAKHKALRVAVQVMLLPLVAFSYSILCFGPLINGFMLGLIFAFPVILIRLRKGTMRRVIFIEFFKNHRA